MTERPSRESPAPGSDETLEPVSGARATRLIGRYRLLHIVGEGGMGEVWRAEQMEPVRRVVAVKLIKTGMATAEVSARFGAERQALALMDHPAIARVFDGGATLDGQPYFVMEYVAGEPITAYCTRNKLALRERIALMLEVCDGVQHAHQKGVIHRDLKPSNILVTLQDGRPVPKVIDFGIAKAITQPLTEQPVHTEWGALMGTPDYMSPEQAEMTGLDVDTRTDVYALGVILYELLTGVLPFDATALREKGLDALRRTIREVDPPRPSTRARGLATSADSAPRRAETSRLASQLRGDLDWITMKALEKDRTRRYGSASDLAADLRRHLDDQPVLASPPSTAYRVRKFTSRHRLSVVAATALVMVLTAFAGSMAVQAQRIARERDRANQEAATAKRVSDFLVSLFTVSDPSEARGNSLTAREVLDTGARKIEKDLVGQPEVQARLMGTIGEVYTNLGLYAAAEPLLKTAQETATRAVGDTHPETVRIMNALANVYWYAGRYADAEPLYLKIVDARRRALGDDHPDTLRANYDLASLYIVQKRFDEGERLATRTLDVQRRVLGNGHADTLGSMGNLASLYHSEGKYAESLKLGSEVMELRRHLLGPDHPRTLTAMHNVATDYAALGKFDEAESLYLAAIQGKRRVNGEKHPLTASTQLTLAQMYVKQRRFRDAEPLALAAYDTLGRSASYSADAKSAEQTLSNIYAGLGDSKKAAEWKAKADGNH